MAAFYFTFLFLVGLLFFWPGMVILRKGLRGRKWPVTNAFVTHSRVDKKMYRWRGSNWINYIPDVRYKYSIEEIEYIGEQTHFGKYKRDKLNEIVAQYPIGKIIQIKYHPKKHNKSLVRPLPISFHVYFFIGLGLILWIFGGLILLIE